MVSIHVGWCFLFIDAVGSGIRALHKRAVHESAGGQHVVNMLLGFLFYIFGLILDGVLSESIGLEVALIL
jgi:hypothetical protein